MRNLVSEKVEKLLNVWMNEQVNKKGSVISGIALRKIACSLYENLVSHKEDASAHTSDFHASKDWLAKFI
jgi:hypothetical protein